VVWRDSWKEFSQGVTQVMAGGRDE
jgi:hypothetical protein